MIVARFTGNPILTTSTNSWESRAVFNPCPIVDDKGEKYILYRAEQEAVEINGKKQILSTVGVAKTPNWMEIQERRQLIGPANDWDFYGCEDPRATWMDGSCYIFYTGLSGFPPSPEQIRVAVAVSKDMKKIDTRHLVTPFNAKAMALFPKKIKGNYAVILTVDTDRPPAKIAVAYLQNLEDLWDQQFWQHWYRKLDHNVISLLRSADDQVEVGAVPVYTDDGWLLIHSYIKGYKSDKPHFGVEAALVDIDNPLKILGRTNGPLLVPEMDYELNGRVPKIVFPSGAIVQNDDLGIFYGGADSCGAVATIKLKELIADLKSHEEIKETEYLSGGGNLVRFSENPILTPVIEHSWENKYALNPAAVEIDGITYIVYRAMGTDNVSVLGLAISKDGLHVDERLNSPIYVPREQFEINNEQKFSGCEDPRITKIGDELVMCYTAYDGVHPTHVAMTRIKIVDFVNRNWHWSKPVVVSPPDKDDKNACILAEKIEDKFVILHRFSPHIWIDVCDDLNFEQCRNLGGEILMSPREDRWDSEKIGIGPPPIKTDQGWLLIYHAISKFDKQYRLGAALLDFSGVQRVESRLDYPILEPQAWYESSGLRPGTVFACGVVEKKDKLFVYYGASDQFVGVATVETKQLLEALLAAKKRS